MSVERRRDKRLDLNVSVELERLDDGGITTLKYATVKVADISKSGMGFDSKEKFEVGSFYDVRLQIWTKEVINTVIEILRVEETGNGYHYGSAFVGLMETDALKIEIYQLFNEI